MKNLKKYLALLAAAALVLSLAACVPAKEEPSKPSVEQNEAPTNEMPTEAPTEEITEATEEVTEASADYSAYMGTWYSGSVALNVEAENKWNMTQNGDVFLTGQLVVNTEDEYLILYDVEGTEAAHVRLDGENSIYAELYMEEMYNRIEDFFFTRDPSEGSSIIDVEEVVNDEVVEGGSSDDTVVDGE